MAHMIDETTGRAATAWVGLPPWHGLGTQMSDNEPLNEWLVKAGMDWKALRRPLGFDVGNICDTETEELKNPTNFFQLRDLQALVRSVTNGFRGMASPKYKIVQPDEVMNFFEDLTTAYGFKMETAGVLREGRIIWALAKTPLATALDDIDEVDAYLLLSTSFDRSLATTARFTSIRVVCNNTLTMANVGGRSVVTIPHSKKFDPDQAKIDLKIGAAWEKFRSTIDRLANTPVSYEDQAKFLLKVYHNVDKPEGTRSEERTMQRLGSILRNSPGSDMPTALGTMWGLLNAVTHDQDYSRGRRNDDNRMTQSWFGGGERLKNKAFKTAMEMAGMSEEVEA